MPNFYPEGNVSLPSDNERRSLIKWNSLLYDAGSTALAFFPEGSAPKPEDDERRSLIKINALVAALATEPGPTFLPEGGDPKPNDYPLRSLQKIVALRGLTLTPTQSETLLLQTLTADAALGTEPLFLPEANASKTTDSPLRSLWKIVVNEGGGGGGAGDPPPMVGSQQYLQADDLTWHMVDLQEEAGFNATRVQQDAVPSPGAEFAGYVVLTADDVTNHRVCLMVENGIYALKVWQSTTFEDGDSSLVLIAPSGTYPVTIVLDGDTYTLNVGQPP